MIYQTLCHLVYSEILLWF